jgi:aryl-alcohol dehydrogenase-like predicted oxidoreductase
VAWSPLGGGFLTGSVTSIGRTTSASTRRASPPATSSGTTTATRPCGSRHELGLAPGQLALAWLLAQDPAVVPVPGSRTPAHIVENVESARVVLHDDTLARLDQALAAFRPEGSTLL